MLSPVYLADCAEGYAFLYSQLEADICADITRRLVKTGHFTRTASWQTKKLKELQKANEGFLRAVSETNNAAGEELRKAMLDAAQTGLKYDDRIHIAAGLTPVSVAKSQALQEVILAGIEKTGGVMQNLTMTTASTAELAFENALDRAYMQVTSGAFSYDSALRQLVRELAMKGFEEVAYPSGSVRKVDSAARTALLTGLNQTTAQLQIARMDELGTELVETTSHAGARPSHAEWQGRIFSRFGGRLRKYPDFVDSTGYGSGDGLCGWNCYHSFFPFYEGISMPSFAHDPAALLGKSNTQVYEEAQKQRSIERAVKEYRRRCVTFNAAFEAATDDALRAMFMEDFERASAKVKAWERVLDEFCEETNRTKYANRIQVYGFDRSVSNKARAAAKRYLSA